MSIALEQLQCFDLSQSFYPNVTFTEVELTDFYRKNKPYRLLTNPGTSSVTMTFGLTGASNVSKVIIELNHRGTSSASKPAGCVDMYLNDTRLNRNIAAPKDRFETVRFQYQPEKFQAEDNRLKLVLGESSPGTYWLSDVTLYVKRIPDKTEKEIDTVSRQLLVNMRKLMTQREKLTDTLRNLAGDLEELHKEIDQFGARPAYGDLLPNGIHKRPQEPQAQQQLPNGTHHETGQSPSGASEVDQKSVNGTCNKKESAKPKAMINKEDLRANGTSNGADGMQNASKCKEQMVKQSSGLLLLGQPAFSCISTATGCPIQVVKRGDNFVLQIGGEAAAGDVGSSWQEVKQLQVVKDMENVIKEDRKSRNMANSCAASLKRTIATREQEYREKFPDVSHATSFEVLGYRFAQVLASGAVLRESLLYQSGFMYLSKAIDCVSLPVFMKALLDGSGTLDTCFTMADLLLKMTELAEGFPRLLAERMRVAADAVDGELLHLKNFMNDSLTTLLNQTREDLDLCNVRHVILRLKLLPIFDQCKAKQGFLDMTWLNTWTGYDSLLPLPQLTSLANALNIIYHKLQEGIKGDGESTLRRVDLVILANGTIGAPAAGLPSADILFPALARTPVVSSSMMFASDHLKSVTFYQPWGTQIDASTFYGIIEDSIEPDETRFLGLGNGPSPSPKTLPNFNTLTAESDVTIPTVWCNAFEESDPALEQLTLLIECDREEPTRPFIWWRFSSTPSFVVTALTSIAAMILSEPGKRTEVCLHHGQCLVWPSTTKAPPKALKEIRQYSNTVADVYRNPPCLTITPLL